MFPSDLAISFNYYANYNNSGSDSKGSGSASCRSFEESAFDLRSRVTIVVEYAENPFEFVALHIILTS